MGFFLRASSSFELVSLIRNFLAVSLLILYICLRSCFCYWVDPPPLNKNVLKNKVFDLGDKMVQVEKKIVGEILEVAGGGAWEWKFTFFLCFSSFFIFQHFCFWIRLKGLQKVLCAAISCVPGKRRNYIPSFASWRCHYSQETTWSKWFSHRHLWPFWRSLPGMM